VHDGTLAARDDGPARSPKQPWAPSLSSHPPAQASARARARRATRAPQAHAGQSWTYCTRSGPSA